MADALSLKRRTVIAAALSLAGCDDESEDDLHSQPIGRPTGGPPPWHLWGGEAQVELLANGNPATQNTQLARVAYGRPETWNFFFGAEFLSVSGAPDADTHFRVAIDLQIGLGRTIFNTLNTAPLFTPPQQLTFCLFNFKLPLGQLPVGNIVTKRWTTSVLSPVLDDDDATSRREIDHIVAQDIQAGVSIIQATGGTNIGAKFAITAFFSPVVHVRPDWFLQHFNGNEVGGK